MALVATLGVATGACGTTHISTNDPSAKIYVDGVMVGTGSAEITQSGTGETAEVVVKAADGRSASRIIDREISAGGWVLCLMTYGIGCLVYQSYPDTVMVMLPDQSQSGGSWDGGDAWSKPPPGWTPPVTETAPATETAPTTEAPADDQPGESTPAASAPAQNPAPAPAADPAPPANPAPPATNDPWQQPPQ